MVLVCVGALVCFPQPQSLRKGPSTFERIYKTKVCQVFGVSLFWRPCLLKCALLIQDKSFMFLLLLTCLQLRLLYSLFIIVCLRIESCHSVPFKTTQHFVYQETVRLNIWRSLRNKLVAIKLLSQLPTLNFFNYLSLVVGCDWVDIKSFFSFVALSKTQLMPFFV